MIRDLWQKEPIRIIYAAALIIVVLIQVAQGHPLDTEMLMTAISIIAGGELARASVYSPATVEKIESGKSDG